MAAIFVASGQGLIDVNTPSHKADPGGQQKLRHSFDSFDFSRSFSASSLDCFR